MSDDSRLDCIDANLAAAEDKIVSLEAENTKLLGHLAIKGDDIERFRAENAKLRAALLRANAIIFDGLDDYWREQNEGRLLELDAVVEYILAANKDKDAT